MGDIVYLSAGDKVPADCIIADGQSLRVDESTNRVLAQENKGEEDVLKNDPLEKKE